MVTSWSDLSRRFVPSYSNVRRCTGPGENTRCCRRTSHDRPPPQHSTFAFSLGAIPELFIALRFASHRPMCAGASGMPQRVQSSLQLHRIAIGFETEGGEHLDRTGDLRVGLRVESIRNGGSDSISGDTDLVRSMLGAFAEAVMSAQASMQCNAGFGERTDERENHRNGYRSRPWHTRVGTSSRCPSSAGACTRRGGSPACR